MNSQNQQQISNKVGYVYDERMLLHFDKGQFEIPDRIVVIYNELKKRGYLNKMNKIESAVITKEELMLAHDEKFIDGMFELFTHPEKDIKRALSKMDSMFGNKDSLLSARVAAGSTLNLMRSVLKGEVRHGVAIVRPPNHHAHKNRPGGFCFFNGTAIAAKYAIQQGKKVVVVDWDCHCGDGTIDIFQNDKSALVISIQRYDHGQFYPGTGKSIESSNILSIPINKIAYDKDYYDIFNNQVMPKIAEYNPDIICVSAGYDAGINDPLCGFKVTPEGFYNMTKMLLYFNKPTILVLEGGYNLKTISDSMTECTRALLEDTKLL